MMHARSIVAALVLLTGLALAVTAQTTPPATPPATPATAPADAPADAKPLGGLKIHLMDGSIISGKINLAQIEVETRYGNLQIPLEQVRLLTPGLESHPAFDQKIAALVADLGADGFAEREKAQQELLKIGSEIRGELERQVKTAEAERQTRLQKILDDFDAQREADEEASANDWLRDDVIVTNSFTIVGKIKTPSFQVASPYGSLAVKIADIRRIQREGREQEELRKNVVVSGSLIPARSFEVTTIHVNKGDQVFITAAGAISMTPWGGNMSSSPDGGPNFGFYQPGNIPGGALMAKISNSGTPFKVGSKYTFTAQQAGVLEFGIAIPGDYASYTFPGQYDLKVRVLRK